MNKNMTITHGLPADSHENLISVAAVQALPMLARLTAYMLLIAAATQCLIMAAANPHYTQLFQEGQCIEWIQVGLMLVTVTLLGLAASTQRPNHIFLRTLTALAAVAVIRELDSILDQLFPIGGWQVVAVPLVLWIAWQIGRHWHTQWRQLWEWLCTPAAGIVWCGMITVVIFAQITGQGHIWQSLLGDGYTRHLKRVVEESTESFGYMLLLFGALETLIWSRMRAAQKNRQDKSGNHGNPSVM